MLEKASYNVFDIKYYPPHPPLHKIYYPPHPPHAFTLVLFLSFPINHIQK
jgi:hypothetical protein